MVNILVDLDLVKYPALLVLNFKNLVLSKVVLHYSAGAGAGCVFVHN
jgi:hypothetical protein